ncbi:transposase [Siccirubricoccus sp. G192]|nr:transposase [Siccirubricoccus sp. G192]
MRGIRKVVRPHGKTKHHDLRHTIEAIIWQHRNGAGT